MEEIEVESNNCMNLSKGLTEANKEDMHWQFTNLSFNVTLAHILDSIWRFNISNDTKCRKKVVVQCCSGLFKVLQGNGQEHMILKDK
jgi:hypothetical protein